MDGNETERRKEMVKPVICDGSLSYRKTQLPFLTWQLIPGYCSCSLGAKGNQYRFSVSCADTYCVFIDECAFGGQLWLFIYLL